MKIDFSQARDRMYEMLDTMISRRRNGEGFQQDFLESLIMKHSKLVEAGGEDDNKLTDKQLKDNILTLLVAGHDTTTAALTWLIKFLGENPVVLEQLRVTFSSLYKHFKAEYCRLKENICRFFLFRKNTYKFKQTERVERILHGLK